MNNQQIKERLEEDGWVESLNSQDCYKKGDVKFYFNDFESHFIRRGDDDDGILFQGKIKTKTQFKALMGMLEI